jgi:hypothetical protein
MHRTTALISFPIFAMLIPISIAVPVRVTVIPLVITLDSPSVLAPTKAVLDYLKKGATD